MLFKVIFEKGLYIHGISNQYHAVIDIGYIKNILLDLKGA